MSKNTAISFKLNFQEMKFLQEMASKNGMSRSKYIRARLFEDQDFGEGVGRGVSVSKELTKYQKDMMKQMAQSLALVSEIAQKTLAENEVLGAVKKAKDWVEKNEYN